MTAWQLTPMRRRILSSVRATPGLVLWGKDRFCAQDMVREGLLTEKGGRFYLRFAPQVTS